MYRPGQYQCLSFGPGKPLDNTRGGAILLDNEEHYQKLKMMSNDGRDLSIARWEDQQKFEQGYHYMMRIEEAESAMTKLKDYQDRGQFAPEYKTYPDCRALTTGNTLYNFRNHKDILQKIGLNQSLTLTTFTSPKPLTSAQSV